jgi:hypothetical protein
MPGPTATSTRSVVRLVTSKWVPLDMAQRDYTVDWQFIPLRMVNSAVD